MSEIDEMAAGSKLDELVAERVFGLERRADLEGVPMRGPWAEPYSTDIRAAWQIVEALPWDMSITRGLERGEGRWYAYVFLPKRLGDRPDEPPTMNACAPTAPLAICRATLSAVNFAAGSEQ